MRASAQLLEEAKKATSNPNDPNNQQRLGRVRITLECRGSIQNNHGEVESRNRIK